MAVIMSMLLLVADHLIKMSNVMVQSEVAGQTIFLLQIRCIALVSSVEVNRTLRMDLLQQFRAEVISMHEVSLRLSLECGTCKEETVLSLGFVQAILMRT